MPEPTRLHRARGVSAMLEGLRRMVAGMGSRSGLVLAILLICGLALTALHSYRSAYLRFSEAQDLSSSTKLVEAKAATTQLFRLLLLLGRIEEGDLDPGIRAELGERLERIDLARERLEARLERIGLVLSSGSSTVPRWSVLAQGDAALVALRRTVDAGRVFQALGPAPSGTATLSAAAETALAELADLVDATEMVEEAAVANQSDMFLSQGSMLATILSLLVLIGVVSLGFLRREVVAWKARGEAETRAEFLAFYDPLTELPNRVKFTDAGHELLARDRAVAILLIDIDNFKDINDKFGHAMGDEVLRQTGQRLGREADENRGIGARLGGDEFAILLPSDNTAFLTRFCGGLLDQLSEPIALGGDSVRPSVSIGLATASQVPLEMSSDIDMLTRVADFALYASKTGGRGRYTLYDAELEREFSARRDMLAELPLAIDRGDLDVYLQPKVELRGGRVYGFEALVRWHRGDKVVPPEDFISTAEEGGHIKDIDIMMLSKAGRVLADWNARHQTDFTLSVNLSALHLLREDDTRRVIRAIKACALPRELLTMEITETVQLDDWSRVSVAMAQLRDTGCRISIDDFGTGYSSLAYLRTIPADELKIDKSLVSEIETSSQSQFILDAVIDLARSLDLVVVIEGIERSAQADVLRDLGCHLGQGFLYGRPLPAREALAAAMSHAGAGGVRAAQSPRRSLHGGRLA